VTVPVTSFPPTTVLGRRLSAVGRGAVAVRRVLAVDVPTVAEIVVPTLLPTARVVAVNVAVEAVATTVTDAGTVTTPVFEEPRVTTVPPVGAGPLKVTVPVEVCPPATEGGANATDSTVGVAVRPRTADFVAPPYADEIVTDEATPPTRVVTA
jgi:hypothetical protein